MNANGLNNLLSPLVNETYRIAGKHIKNLNNIDGMHNNSFL